MKKYKLLQDRKLAFASKILKMHSKSAYHSISHSYPICIIAESNEKIGVDIENSNRKIN
jgi:phosphopantetheinyl transferase